AGFKSQFKRADASGARVAVILGADEVASQTASVKFLRAEEQGEAAQQQVPLAKLADALNNKG
ncbi:His/Gly/Thr/Pro-type tRNA ligase C-terminal domain-containing protein, partial [Achromobacter sp.]